MQASSALHNQSKMPILSAWMVDGLCSLDRSLHFSSRQHRALNCVPRLLLIVVVELYHCPNHKLRPFPEIPFNEPSIAMCSRKPSTLLSHDRDVSEIHCFVHGLLPAQCSPNWGCDTSLPCHCQSSLGNLSFHMTLLNLALCYFTLSIDYRDRIFVFHTF